MVTGPIGKEAIRLAGSPFAGHTDMLQALAGVPATRMAMVFGRWRVVMTTLHVAWRDVSRLLTETAVYETIMAAHEAFATARRPFPVIAVAGLNPHAGEHGLFGDEEERAIGPAIARARAVNPNVSGPWPADSLFKAERRRVTDVFVAQTHDQGLIAIKTLGGLRCVNVTLGLPYIRTSVGHGTAYDIAGQGRADHRGLLAALTLARRMALARRPSSLAVSREALGRSGAP
jgi:4-hydroxythreonine-4-phosphate dehydrogenase